MPKSNKAVDVSHGKKFERFFADDVIAKLDQKYPMTCERVIDSAAAGNVIRKADCDFKTCIRGEAIGRPFHFLWEMKASVRFQTFSEGFKDLIDASQLAQMRKSERAGAFCIYVFLNVPEDEIEVWPAKALFEPYHAKRQKFSGYPAYTIARSNFKDWFVLQVLSNPAEFIRQMESYS